jgi:hypothetical protein
MNDLNLSQIRCEEWSQPCMEYFGGCENWVRVRGRYAYLNEDVIHEIEAVEDGAEIYNKDSSMVRCPACVSRIGRQAWGESPTFAYAKTE